MQVIYIEYFRVCSRQVGWFNGGLFDDDAALPLEKADIDTVLAASNLNWSEIDGRFSARCSSAVSIPTGIDGGSVWGSGRARYSVAR